MTIFSLGFIMILKLIAEILTHILKHTFTQRKGKQMRILHLEDSPAKYTDIRAVLLSCGIRPDDIVWVKNLTDGIFELKEAEKGGNHFDLAITDMYYPVEPGGYEEPDTGYKFVEFVRNARLKLPIVICSSVRINDGSVLDCLWYSALSNWEIQLREIISRFD